MLPVATQPDRRQRRPRGPKRELRPPAPAALPTRVFRLQDRHDERGAGLILRFQAEHPSRLAAAVWLLVAVMIGGVLLLPARGGSPFAAHRVAFAGVMLGALALALRAFIRSEPYRFELDRDVCRVHRRGKSVVVHRLPIERGLPRDAPLCDADGQPFCVPEGFLPTIGLHAIMVRSSLCAAPIEYADRVVLEAIGFSRAVGRGRADGYLGVAISRGKTPRALAVFADRESYTGWAESAPPHTLAGVFATDQSGKGADIGYPSPVVWGLKPTKLLRRARVYVGDLWGGVSAPAGAGGRAVRRGRMPRTPRAARAPARRLGRPR